MPVFAFLPAVASLAPLVVGTLWEVPNPAPADPTSGAEGIILLISYVKWGSLIACSCSAVASGGYMAVGSLSNRPDAVEKGKRALLWSLGGVLVSAMAIPLTNGVFDAAS